MIEIRSKKDCCGCEVCEAKCPKRCIKMIEDEEGFKYPIVDKNICIDCKICEKICPIINPIEKLNQMSYGFGAVNKTLKKFMESSSGGIFPELAIEILKRNGKVVGCIMSDDCREANHKIIDSLDKLKLAYGSKYIQSNIKPILNEIKINLELGEEVLFVGLPCQVQGLKKYLGKDYKKLICVDLICHGVPSNKIWKSNLNKIEKDKKIKIKKVNFRSKKYGGYSEYGIEYSGDKKYFKFKEEDIYFQLFINDYILRPSCYKCRFKGISRVADITLGDFWGAEQYITKLDIKKGVSIVTIHSEKGEILFDKIKEKLEIEKIDIEEAFKKNNLAMTTSCKEPTDRKKVWEELEKNDYNKLKERFIKLSLKEKIKIKLLKLGLLQLFRKIKRDRNDYKKKI